MNKFYELISDNAGKKIKRERQAWGMSRRRLARLAKTDKETIEYIENGYVCMLDTNLLKMISEALDIPHACLSLFIFLPALSLINS